MTGGLVPFLWLCGTSGVGKSTVGWEVFNQIRTTVKGATSTSTRSASACQHGAPGDRGPANARPRGGPRGTERDAAASDPQLVLPLPHSVSVHPGGEGCRGFLPEPSTLG